MTPTVLVALDGSEKDDRALAVAAALVELAAANARVVRVIAPAHASRATVEDSVRDAATRLGAQTHRDVAWEVPESADIGRMLLQQIEKHTADFIVLATRAAGTVDRTIHGSVADQLLRESPRPIVLVPPGAERLRDKRVQLRRVLVPLDGSRESLSVLTYLLALPRAGEMDFVVLQVARAERTGGHLMPPGIEVLAEPGEGPEWVHVKADVAERRLNEVAARLRASGASAQVRVVESRNTGGVIIDASRNDVVDLIAMATRGAGGLQRALLGSTAEYVLRRSEVPVFLVTPRSISIA